MNKPTTHACPQGTTASFGVIPVPMGAVDLWKSRLSESILHNQRLVQQTEKRLEAILDLPEPATNANTQPPQCSIAPLASELRDLTEILDRTNTLLGDILQRVAL